MIISDYNLIIGQIIFFHWVFLFLYPISNKSLLSFLIFTAFFYPLKINFHFIKNARDKKSYYEMRKYK